MHGLYGPDHHGLFPVGVEREHELWSRRVEHQAHAHARSRDPKLSHDPRQEVLDSLKVRLRVAVEVAARVDDESQVNLRSAN